MLAFYRHTSLFVNLIRQINGFFYFCCMPGQNFELLPILDIPSNRNLQKIFHSESGLRIIVYPLLGYKFKRKPDELCFFAIVHSWWAAFQTDNVKEHQHDFIPEALNWYANRKLIKEMHVQIDDPRKNAILVYQSNINHSLVACP